MNNVCFGVESRRRFSIPVCLSLSLNYFHVHAVFNGVLGKAQPKLNLMLF